MTDRPDVPGSSWVADRFQQERNRLVGVAYRLLGSTSEAEDAVQEAWLRLSRSDPESVENMSAWLTTVVARISLNMLRDRRSRREDPLDDQADRECTCALSPTSLTRLTVAAIRGYPLRGGRRGRRGLERRVCGRSG